MRISISLAGASALLTLASCGGGEAPATPAACLAPAAAYLTALESAPDPVVLAGGISISECLVAEQEPGALAQVGEALVGTATQLNARARRDPSGEATVQLGYLVGAVQEAATATGGIHEDLKLRLDAAARFLPGGAFSAGFERAFGTGYGAGQATG